jgi:MinD-like ATPase involved in chromosome partitioning or flagellar assembly
VDDEWWPEDEEDGEPVPSAGSARPPAIPVKPDYRPQPPRPTGDLREELAREIARREDGAFEEEIQQIYEPSPPAAKPSASKPPVSRPPVSKPSAPKSSAPKSSAPSPKPVPPVRQPEREPAAPPQYEQVQPGQLVSPEWRREPEAPLDLPQAPESAWAQPPAPPPPTASPAPTASPPPSTPRANSLRGVPHQVPPAPMPRPGGDLDRARTEPQAELGLQGAVRRSTFGLIKPSPGRREQERNADLEMVERQFGGMRQITVVNPKAGAGKTIAMLLLAMTFGQHRSGESVLAWDVDSDLGQMAGFARRTEQELMNGADLSRTGTVADLLGSPDPALDFGDLRDTIDRFYRLIVVGTGNDPRSLVWQDAVDATDQLVLTMAARNDSAESAARTLDFLERNGRTRIARQAVTVMALPQNQRDFDVSGIERHFAARTRAVIRVPYDRLLDGRPVDIHQLSDATRAAWLKVAAAVAEGL